MTEIIMDRSLEFNSVIDTFDDKASYRMVKEQKHYDKVREEIEQVAETVKWNSFITFTQGSQRTFDKVSFEAQILETIKRVTTILDYGYSKHDDHMIADYARKLPRHSTRRMWKSGEIKPYYLLAIEPHKTGHPHGHLLIGHSRVSMSPDYCPKLWDAVWGHVCPNAGRLEIEKPKNINSCIKYTTKYILKGGDATSFTMHLPFEDGDYVPF